MRRSVVFTSTGNVVSIVLNVERAPQNQRHRQRNGGSDDVGSKFIIMYEGLSAFIATASA